MDQGSDRVMKSSRERCFSIHESQIYKVTRYMQSYALQQLWNNIINDIYSISLYYGIPYMQRLTYIMSIHISNHYSERQLLWQLLVGKAKTTTNAWVIIGDFNSASSPLDRKGGFPFNIFVAIKIV